MASDTDRDLERRYAATLNQHASVDLRWDHDADGWIARFANPKTTILVAAKTIPDALRTLADKLHGPPT